MNTIMWQVADCTKTGANNKSGKVENVSFEQDIQDSLVWKENIIA